MEGLRKLYTGDFNGVSQEVLPDGSIVITLSKRGENKTYRFRVKNLYKENEKVLEHEVIEIKIPKYIQDGMREARGVRNA